MSSALALRRSPWRSLFSSIGLALLLGAAAHAHGAERVLRVGWLSRGGPSPNDASMGAFRQGMQELGHVEGKTFVIEPKYAEGRSDIMGQQAAELEAAGVDAIIAGPYEGAAAAKLSTRHVPIVMTPGLDPVATGVIGNPARPEGHITAITEVRPDLTPQRLRLLQQLAPGLKRVGILWHTGTLSPLTIEQTLAATRQAGQALGIDVKLFGAASPADFDAVFADIARQQVDGLIVLTSPVFGQQRQAIVAKAAALKLPAAYEWRSFVQSGGLLSYGADVLDVYRRAAGFVDKLGKGTKVADLPVEAPIKLELVVNLQAAKALGLTVPDEVRRQATAVIE